MNLFGNLKSEVTVHANVLCKWRINCAVSDFIKVVFIAFVDKLIDENKVCSRDVNIFNPDTSYVI